MPTTPNKTIQTALVAWQDIATGAVVLSSAVNVAGVWDASFFVRVARRSSSAFTAGWPNIRIEASNASSGNQGWIPLFTLQPPVGASVGKTTLNGAITAAATTAVLTSATNFVQGDLVYLGHTTTAANYEIVRVKSIASTTITFEEAGTFAHDNGCDISNQPFIANPAADLTPYTRVRAVVDNANGGITISVEVIMITMDSAG